MLYSKNFRFKNNIRNISVADNIFCRRIFIFTSFFVLNKVSMLARLYSRAYAFTWTNSIPADRAPRLSQVRSHLNGLGMFACKVIIFNKKLQ